MKAVRCDGAGDVEVLRWTDVDDPQPGTGEVVVDVVGSAVNRADLMQRQGLYPPPAGVTDTLGLECAGTIAAVGRDVTGWAVGDEVCALLAGGGNAERALVPVGQLMPVPPGVELAVAGTLPEVACTVWSTVVMHAGLAAGDVVLVHGGSSGIGTMAIQVAVALGATVVATAGSDAKLERCRALGAHAVSYRTEDFVARTRELTDGHGADIVLDVVGAKYLPRNVDVLATGGRLVVIGMQGGTTGELDLSRLLAKRASVHALSLRSRPLPEKAAICQAVVAGLWPLLADGRVVPVVDSSYPMDRIADAHARMAEGGHIGKISLSVP